MRGSVLPAVLGILQGQPAPGSGAWPLKAWLGVCAYVAGFLLVAWLVWRLAGPGEEESDDLGHEP